MILKQEVLKLRKVELKFLFEGQKQRMYKAFKIGGELERHDFAVIYPRFMSDPDSDSIQVYGAPERDGHIESYFTANKVAELEKQGIKVVNIF